MRFFVFLLCILAWLLATEAKAHAQNPPPKAIISRVFSGITAAQASAPVPNRGQSMHLLYVFFPTESTTQTGLQIRIEASFDNVTYWPISEDITQATSVGGIVYAVTSAFAPWPFVRIRSLTTAPAAMTVRYAGHTIPVVGLIQTESDRFLL